MEDGFVKVACATPNLKLADCNYNAKEIVRLVEEADRENISVLVFPELSVSGYSCGDLFFNKKLQEDINDALRYILDNTKTLEMLIIVGVICEVDFKLYNCAAVIYKGEVLGIVPKQYIPNYSQYNELRYFSPGQNNGVLRFLDRNVPFGTDLIFQNKEYKALSVGVEICEDLWSPKSPSDDLAIGGATIIANLSASDEEIGKSCKREMLINAQSLKLSAAYLYANAGFGESSTDLVYAGHNVISEMGEVIAESKLFTTGLTIADIDLRSLVAERRRRNTFNVCSNMRTIFFDIKRKNIELKREVYQNPFINKEQNENLSSFCDEVLALQSEGLAARLRNINVKKVVIGVSGGLDSSLALFVALEAFNKLKYDKENIICVSMPGMGTSDLTLNNAKTLVKILGCSYMEISINSALRQHFEDIKKDANKCDVTYENAQARERTQILMDLANMYDAIVIGTCDLSEIALGFSTYNGDHMSMYNVNAGVPKTVVRKVILNKAENCSNQNLRDVLLSILNTPISPELLPTEWKVSKQITENIIGPYELHDFFLYYFLKYGFTSDKILKLAMIAFKDKYQKDEVKKYLTIFLERFFKNQFKRSCQPAGPKIFDVSLSPRNSFMMPSDIALPDGFI